MCSALLGLSEAGTIDSRLAAVAEQAQGTYNDAIDEMSGLGDDEVILELCEWLFGIAERVADELSGEVEPGKFAADFFRGAFGDGPEESNALDGALLLSLQWDSDPKVAIAEFTG